MSLSSPVTLGSYGWMSEAMALQVMVGSGLVGILHIALLNKRVGSLGCKDVCDVVGCERFSCCKG